MDAAALLKQQILSTVSDPLAQAALRPHLSAAIESATDTEQDVSPSTSRLIKQLLRIDDQDQYRSQYHWPSTTFDGRELLALERMGSRDYVEDADRHSLIQTLQSTLDAGISVLGYVGSVLDKPYAATRGIIGGTGALLRGDWKNAAKGFNQILLMLPFSESYLKGLYKAVGLPIPDEHLSGREALEMWGAPKNRPGFHPIKQPIDALFDAAGLVLDLFAVPYLPRFGALSAKGQQLYRLGKGAKIVAKMEEAIQQLGTKVGTLPPHVLRDLKDKPLAEILETLGRAVQLSEPELQHLRLWRAELPAGATELERALRNALGQSDTVALGALLRDIPTHLRFYQALEGGLRPIPAVSLEGRAQELRQGVRVPLVLEAPWPARSIFEALGLPTQIEVGTGETTAKALETVGNWIGVRHLRALFDWTRKDVADAVAGPAMSLAVDRLHHVAAASKDLLVQWRAWQASMANMAAKYAQLAQLGNNEVGVRTFGDLLRYIVEHSRKINGTLNDKAAALARQIFDNQPVEAGLMDWVRDLTATMEGELVPTAVAFTQKLQQLGAPIKPWQSPWIAWFPRYTPSTTAESGWSAIGPKIFTAKQAAKGKSRRLALDVPGGTLLLNAVSKDLVLIKPARKAATDGVVAVTDMAGRFWMVGDYVHTPQGQLGRIIRFKPGDTAMLRYGNGATQEIGLIDLTKTPPPAGLDTYISMDRLNREEQFQAALAWLKHHNIPLPQISNKKALMHKALQLYLVHRYAKPFLPHVHEDLQRLFFSETPFASIKEAVKHVKQIYYAAGINISTRQIKALGRVLYEKQGTSALLLDYLRTLRADRGLFSTDILDDLTRRLSYNADAMMALTGVHQMFRLGAFVDETASRGLTLRDAWLKLRWPKSNKPLTTEGLRTLWQHLPQELIQRAHAARSTTGKDLDQIVRVPEEVVTHAQRLLRVLLPQTEEAIWVEKIVRKYLGWVASWLTVSRPAYQLRNATSNALSGAIADAPYDTLPFLKYYYNALTHGLKGEWQKLPWYDEMAQLGVWGGQQKLADITLEAMPATKPFATLLHPLAAPADAKTIAQTLANWPGYLEALKGKRPSPIIEAGRQTFGLVEGVGRAAVYMAAREAGATPAQAKALVDRVLYDYSRLSGFERRYMQPTLMFYGWLRQNLGYLLPRITVDWGSGPAKLLRGLTVIQDRFGRGELPKWMQDNLGFPLWEGDDGHTVVVRSLGLPLEDLALLDFELPRLVAKVYARANPVFKGAYMLATGEDPFTDLPLREAQPAVERFVKNIGIDTSRWYSIRPPLNIAEQFVPYAAVLGYYARLLQSRHAPTPLHEAVARGIDFLSGVKIGSYDLEEQQLNELTELLQERLRSMPGVRTYFRPYVATPYPTPAVEKHMALYKLLEKRWRKEAEERKKLKQQPALPLQLGGLEFR